MTLTSIFTKSDLAARWHSLGAAWRWALGVFLIARVGYTLWSWVVLILMPMPVQNLDLFGTPVLAAFDLASSQRFVYSRNIADTTLTFRAIKPGTVSDLQSGSLWTLSDGLATTGTYNGRALESGHYTVEDVFPYRGVAPTGLPLIALWERFDSNWYLKIAERGYGSDDGSAVYFPLYPMLIRVITLPFGGDALPVALLISNAALVGVLFLLYQFSAEFVGVNGGRRAVVYLVIFPTAFFLFAAYTESVFLLLVMGSLYSARRHQWLIACVLGALAALTRLQGALLVLPLAYIWLTENFTVRSPRSHGKVELVTSNRMAPLLTGLPLLLIPAATFIFLGYTNLSLFSSYETQLHARFVPPWENLYAALVLISNRTASYVDLLNLLVVVLLGVMCIAVWRKLPREFGIYALAMFLAPLFRMTTSQPLVSMSRYSLAIFPIFILWGGWGANPWVNRAVLYLSLPLALFLSAQFWMWGWVA